MKIIEANLGCSFLCTVYIDYQKFSHCNYLALLWALIAICYKIYYVSKPLKAPYLGPGQLCRHKYYSDIMPDAFWCLLC